MERNTTVFSWRHSHLMLLTGTFWKRYFKLWSMKNFFHFSIDWWLWLGEPYIFVEVKDSLRSVKGQNLKSLYRFMLRSWESSFIHGIYAFTTMRQEFCSCCFVWIKIYIRYYQSSNLKPCKHDIPALYWSKQWYRMARIV